MNEATTPKPIAFKAETHQLLDILIHSLYTEREIFLRELISNASDALTRLDFEMLTNRDVLDPDLPLEIRVRADATENILTIEDTGIGMGADEMRRDLGTIAHSGARDFFEAVKESGKSASDLIGQFGVGFYSAFMVADWIRVTSKSQKQDVPAATWYCTGSDTFTIEPAEREKRGTAVMIKLKEDAKEFCQENRLREIIRKHSDFVPYPVFLGDSTEQINRQTAIWRQNPRTVEEKEYEEFYQQLTLDFEPAIAHAHMIVDAPVQLYAILFIPSKPERNFFSLRKEDGIKLYSRKVLIQEFYRDLLPEYFRFVEGVVDSEDIPLNVSRESIQSNRVMAQLKKLLTTKLIDTLKKLGEDNPEKYSQFWQGFSQFIKQGIAIEKDEPEALYPLLRFHTTNESTKWVSLDEYIQSAHEGQDQIYYIMGEDERALVHSPHLDPIRRHGYPTLLMADPLDAFVLTRLRNYQGHALVNVASADFKVPTGADQLAQSAQPALAEEESVAIIQRFKDQLGDQVSDVRMSTRLSDSPARLVDPEGAPDPEVQRVYRLLKQDYELPKKVLELNSAHPILLRINELPENDPIASLVIQQVFEDALLIEGLHPDPSGMIERIQKLMEAAIGQSSQGRQSGPSPE